MPELKLWVVQPPNVMERCWPVCLYFTQTSKSSDKIPNFQVSWLKAIELRLMKLADSLVSEYDRDMQAQLEGKLPMVEGTNGETGETMMNIHLQVFAKKRLQFQKEILPFHLSKESELGTDLLSYFDRSISESVKNGDHDQVIGGRFFNFIQANIKSSEKYCVAVYNEEYNKTVRPKVENALLAQIPVTVEEELTSFRTDYYRLANGPAADEIFKQLRTESVRFEDELSLIPGPIHNLEVVGASSDRVKLRWGCPEVNSLVINKYVVMIKSKSKDWEEVASQESWKFSTLITGLQSSTWYCFTVLASNEKYTGNQASPVKARTGMSEAAHKSLRATSMIAPPIALPYMLYKLRQEKPFARKAIPVIGDVLFTTAVSVTPLLGQLAACRGYNQVLRDQVTKDIEDTEVLYQSPDSALKTENKDLENINRDAIPNKDQTMRNQTSHSVDDTVLTRY